MRRADDLSDDESMPRAARRAALDRWLDGWRQALASGATEDPVFLALLDTRRRFAIPPALLEELVQGTAMDLMDPADPAGSPRAEGANGSAALATYATFAELYRYCYLVASVVGLVCIRIFGYTDPRAQKLAEETGVAFQLTNILRDVGEDAGRGRLYLPLEDLESCGAAPNEFVSAVHGGPLTPAGRAVLQMEARRARNFYHSAERLLPLISSDSRPALWVLVAIYRRLLGRIEARGFDVFSAKIALPAYEKLAILACGILKTLLIGRVANSHR
jgi:phytoene synthase